MSALATSAHSVLVADSLASGRPAPRLFEPPQPAGGASLEELVLDVWEDLSRSGHAGCPVCGGAMRAGDGCDGCGSSLS